MVSNNWHVSHVSRSAAWLDHARELGCELSMVSNNWHVSHVSRSAGELGMDYISFACKPLPFAITAGMKRRGARKEEAVMEGDQHYTDQRGGKLARVTTILVKPQSTADLWYTHHPRQAAVHRRSVVHADLPHLRAHGAARRSLRGVTLP